MSNLLYELLTPEWTRQFCVSDRGFAILQTASVKATLADQEAYIRESASSSEVPGLLNALSYAHDKGLL